MSATTTDPFAWPEDRRIAELRAERDTALAQLAAVRTYADAHATGLGTLACDSISARHVLALLSGAPTAPDVAADQALRDAAHDLRTNAARAWGDTYAWLTTGRHVANLAADWITDIADGRTQR